MSQPDLLVVKQTIDEAAQAHFTYPIRKSSIQGQLIAVIDNDLRL